MSVYGSVDTLNEEDGIYAGPSIDGLVQTNTGKHLMLNLAKDQDEGYTGTFNIGVNAPQGDLGGCMLAIPECMMGIDGSSLAGAGVYLPSVSGIKAGKRALCTLVIWPLDIAKMISSTNIGLPP